MSSLLHVLLFDQGRLDLLGLQDTLLHQQFAETLLACQDRFHVLPRQVPPLGQDDAELLVVGIGVEDAAVVDHVDLKLAVVLDEDEHVADGIDPTPAGEDHVPIHVAELGIALFQCRHTLHLGHDPACAELAQFRQQEERVGAVGGYFRNRDEPDAVRHRHIILTLGARGGVHHLHRQGIPHLGSGNQCPEPGNNLFRFAPLHRIAPLRDIEHPLDKVPRPEGQVHQVASHRHLAVADLVEDRLHFVGEGGDILEAEHGAGPLDGVHGPEHAADEVHVVRVLFQLQERALQLGEQLVGLFPVSLPMGVH